ncbi:MAG: PKD domain-containing protein [Flavobacteriales bacterium]
MKYLFIAFIVCLEFLPFTLQAQCDAGTPTFVVDLSTDPNGTWISPDTTRASLCCGASAPDRCVQFIVTLHSNAEGIIFNIYSGAIPPGALFYQVACGPPTPVGEALCLNGPGPHSITFCKPGNNNNQYSILSVADPGVGPNIVVNDGCNGDLYAFGYEIPSLIWTSVYPGAVGEYNNYLSCTSACDSVNVVAQAGFPPYVDYQVCGFPLGGCDTTYTCDTVRSTFNSTLAATILPVNPTVCFGTSGTTITAYGGGGTPPYNYLWNTGDTSQSIFVNVGTYSVIVGDSSGCPPTSTSVVVTSFASAISADAGQDQTVCEIDIPIALSGSVVAASGGTWTGGNGSFSPDNNTLNASYTPTSSEIANGSVTLYLTTTGNGSCPPATDTVLLSIVKFNASILTVSNGVSCFGGSDGSGIVSLSGGVPPYTVTWNTAPIQVGDTAIGLVAGTYTATLTDGNGCDTVISITITEPPVLTSVISGVINVSCTGGNNGAATVNPSGGTAPYTYLWDSNAGNQTTSTATNLVAGTYDVVVTDSNGCTTTSSAAITEPASSISLVISTTDVSCAGGSDGTATAIPSGGTPPYTYLWSANTGNQTTSTATNLPIGLYTITVTDTNNCIIQPGIIINEPLPLTTSITFTDVSCYGGNNGTATVTPSGGTAPYSYLWDSNAGNQTTSTATSLIAGTYNVTITDTNDCVFDTLVIVGQPLLPLSIATSVTNVSCYGGNNGTATVIPSGGIAPYSYLWDANAGNQTTSSITGLLAGNYTVFVNDTNGCIDSTIVTISQPLFPLSFLTSYTPVSCKGGNDGVATVNPSGGTPSYTYLWDINTGYQTTSSAVGLVAGNYQVMVTDTNGCFDTISVAVTEPDLIVVMATPMDTICPSENIQIGATVTGGNGGYIYNWNQGLPSNQTNTVSPGTTTTYSVFVTDALGCTGNTDSVTIYVLNLYLDSLSTISSGDICLGGATQISGGYSAGIGNYTFTWNQGLPNGFGPYTVSPITTTDYVFTVTDQCNNSISDSVTVNVFPLPIINLPPVIANGCEPLLVNFKDTLNDSTTVNYLWGFGDGYTSTYASSNHIYNNSGTYNITLTITSAGGCVSTSTGNSVVIVNPSPIAEGIAIPFVTDIQNPTISFKDLSIGSVSVFWDFGDGDTSNVFNPSHTYQDIGTYNVTLTSINQFGCKDVYQLQVTIEPFYTFDIPNAFTPSPGGGNGGTYDPTSLLNDVFYPTTEYVLDFHMLIFNRWGELIFESFDIKIGWDGYYRGVMAQQDVYVWKIDITYIDNKKLSKVGDLTLIR